MHNRALHSKQQRARSCFNREIWGLRNLIYTLHITQCTVRSLHYRNFRLVFNSCQKIVDDCQRGQSILYFVKGRPSNILTRLAWPLPRSFLLCKKSQIIVHGMWAAVQKYPDLMPIRSDPQLFLPILQHFIAFPGLCTRAPYLGGEGGWICFPQQPPPPPASPTQSNQS